MRALLLTALAIAICSHQVSAEVSVDADAAVEQEKRRSLILEQIRLLQDELQSMPLDGSISKANRSSEMDEDRSNFIKAYMDGDADFGGLEGEEEEEEEEEEEKLTFSQERVLIITAVVVVTLIVVISIAFEKMQEWLEDHIMEVLEPVLKSIFGELTILGFIGLIMFFVTKFGKHGLVPI